LIERFYAGQSSMADRLRILAGVPPVPVSRALAVLTGLGLQPKLLGPTVLGQ
jgi:lycopene beta-cyclase